MKKGSLARFAAACLLLLVPTPATEQTASPQLLSEIQSNLPSGRPDLLTAQDLRQTLTDMVNLGLGAKQDYSPGILQLLSAGGSAVNGLYIKNATTGNPAVIGAVGSDSNIGIQLIAKGSAGQLGFQIINAGGANILVPMQAGGTNSGTGEVVLSGNTSGSLSMVGTPTGGHVAIASTSIPTLSGCTGTGSALFGTDTVGSAKSQNSNTTQCTVTFGTAYANPPFCNVTGETAAPTSYSVNANSMTVNYASVANYQFVWMCFGL